MATFTEEKLISLIHASRKLLSCNLEQQVTVLPQLARIFQFDEMSFSLMNIIVSGLCQNNLYERIPTAVYDKIESVMPSDKELNLNDSVYESRLVEEKRNGDRKSIKKQQALPKTLVRIPTDLQCHLFHYLQFKDLINVQKVCRALCIAARNPSALYRLDINPKSFKNGHFSNECYSRPKVLSIQSCHCFVSHDSASTGSFLVSNERWDQNVVELCTFLGPNDNIYVMFQRLEKCRISSNPSILRYGVISSYDTLKELTLTQIMLTEDIIQQIQNFENLEKLSLERLVPNSDRLSFCNPISLPKLKIFSYKIGKHGFREFQRFLIGSNAETIFNIDTRHFPQHDTAPEADLLIPTMSAIKEFNVSNGNLHFFDAMSLWLHRAAASVKLFNQIHVNIDLDYLDFTMHSLIPHLSVVFQHSNVSKLDVQCKPQYLRLDCDIESVVTGILNAPSVTFTEIEFNMEFDLLNHCKGTGEEVYTEYLLDQLPDDEESRGTDQKIIKSVVMRSIADAERWMKPWLEFSKERMKQIGLEKLDVTFVCCNMTPDYFDIIDAGQWDVEKQHKAKRIKPIFNRMISKWMNERVAYWNKRGRQFLKSVAKNNDGYEVIFSLRD